MELGKNTKRIALLVIVPWLGGCSLLQQMQGQVKQNSGENVTMSDSAGEGYESFNGTLLELFKRGVPLQCRIDETDEQGNSTKGEVYLMGERMRGKFEMTQAGGEQFDGEVIRDNEWTYSWSSLFEQGTKFKNEAADEGEVDKQTDEPFDVDEQANFECRQWKVDETMFTPPSDIEFLDVGAQIQQIQENSQDINELRCGTCEQLSGEQRSQCLQALGC